jgi:hypothetical protein
MLIEKNSFIGVYRRDGRIDQWPAGFFDEGERDLMTLLEPGGE